MKKKVTHENEKAILPGSIKFHRHRCRSTCGPVMFTTSGGQVLYAHKVTPEVEPGEEPSGHSIRDWANRHETTSAIMKAPYNEAKEGYHNLTSSIMERVNPNSPSNVMKREQDLELKKWKMELKETENARVKAAQIQQQAIEAANPLSNIFGQAQTLGTHANQNMAPRDAPSLNKTLWGERNKVVVDVAEGSGYRLPSHGFYFGRPTRASVPGSDFYFGQEQRVVRRSDLFEPDFEGHGYHPTVPKQSGESFNLAKGVSMSLGAGNFGQFDLVSHAFGRPKPRPQPQVPEQPRRTETYYRARGKGKIDRVQVPAKMSDRRKRNRWSPLLPSFW